MSHVRRRASLDGMAAHEPHLRVERQMRRVAHDLHDGPVQTLTAALLELRSGSRRIADDHTCQESLTRSVDFIQAALDEIREIIAYHRPAALDEPLVAEMLRVFLDDVRVRHPEPRVEYVFEGDEDRHRLTDSVRIALFRIVQEAVTNAVEHAQASTIRVNMRFAEDGIHCSVEDDGRGIPDLDELVEAPRGHGLVSMRDRAELIDGVFTIRSAPDEGTTVSVRFPA